MEISTVLNYTYKVNFEYRLKIWYRLISKNSGIEPIIYRSVKNNSGIEPVIYRSVSKNSYIEPALLLFHTVLMGTMFYVKIILNYNVSIEYRVSSIEQKSGIDQYRTKPGIEPAQIYIYIYIKCKVDRGGGVC